LCTHRFPWVNPPNGFRIHDGKRMVRRPYLMRLYVP
jgi:hypothetical protein